MYGDPDRIRQLSRHVHEQAQVTRDEADHATAAAQVMWTSPAAARYRERLSRSVQLAGGAVAELDQLEHALLEHAQEVERRLVQIARAERWFRQQAQEATSWAARADHMLQQALHEVTKRAGEAAQAAWNSVESFTQGQAKTAEDAARRAADEARRAHDAAVREAQRWQSQMNQLIPGQLDWVGRARDFGWRE